MGLLAERALVRTGALQKADPLPVGRYWIDVVEDKMPIFEHWLQTVGQRVTVLSTEFTPGKIQFPTPSDPLGGKLPGVQWYLFRVNAPAPWGIAAQIGWPTIAGENVKTQSDTTTAQDSIDATNADFKAKWGWVPWVAGGAVVVAGLFAVAKLVRG